MKTIKIISVGIIAVVLCLFFCFNVILIKIEVGQTGVRTKQYALFSGKGLEKKDFGPGWHRALPVVDTWNVFDSTVQTAEFTTKEQRQHERTILEKLTRRGETNIASTMPTTGPEMIEITTEDGNIVSLDATVKYRIKTGEVYQVFEKYNTETNYKAIVRDQVQFTLRTVFGDLKTESFYHPEERREKTIVAKQRLAADLESRHIELVDILVRDISFVKEYEQKILMKKLADQDVELNKSLTLREEKLGETNKIMAKTEADVKVIKEEERAALISMKADIDKEIAQIAADAHLKEVKIKAEADLYAAEKIALATLLEKEAEAKGETLRAQALKGSGGANYVALQAIKNLNLEEMSVSTLEVDFLNLEEVVEKLGAVKE